VLRLQAGTQPPREFRPDEPVNQLEDVRYPARVTTRRYGRVGYLKINNCLYDNGLIADFDSALTTLADTRGLVLDLRETPSGGNTSVARAIIGRFLTREQAYQKHELPEEQVQTGICRRWLELASPRPGAYRRPVVVLAGHWTGSMGEGLVIGFSTLPQVRVAGTELAGLPESCTRIRCRARASGSTSPSSGFTKSAARRARRFARATTCAPSQRTRPRPMRPWPRPCDCYARSPARPALIAKSP